jgi:CBS domain containing-hemolysin-like protein
MIPLELFLVVLFIVLHAFFSLAETSILNVRKSRLQEIVDDPETPAPRLLRANKILSFKLNPDDFLAVIQSGSVLFSFFAAMFSTIVAMQSSFLNAGSDGSFFTLIGFILIILIVAMLDFTFGALVPKSIALHQSEPIAFAITPALTVLMKFLQPAMRIPILVSRFTLQRFRNNPDEPENRISEEEIRMMLEEGAESGAIDKTENELIENIFGFNERTAREAMVPRIKMIALDFEIPRERLIEQIISDGFTRLPVYQDTLDNILGVVYSKDVLALIEHPELIILYDIIRPVPVVPETKLLAELLREFQRERLHMAIVIDEFGGTAGIITLEDILEEIVGEIQDEYDIEQNSALIAEDKKSITLSASYSIVAANQELEKVFEDFQIPEDEEYESVSGYVNKLFGHIPDVGEERRLDGVGIIVTAKGPMNISEVRIEQAEHIPEAN